MTPFNVDTDLDLEALSEMQLVEVYVRVRSMLALRLTNRDGSESLEMLFARIAQVAEVPRTPTVKVSPREREVLHFVAQDKTNAQIAALLFLSPFTVKNHIANLFEKYGVRSRQSLVMAGIRDGTLTVD